MPPEASKWLSDVLGAADRILAFTRGRTRAEFEADDLLRSAVQWQFAIIGEAMTRLRRDAPAIAGRISEHGRIIAFRNQILHGYDVIRHEITWQVVEEKLPVLRREIADLLSASWETGGGDRT